jgi:hypothetical protein
LLLVGAYDGKIHVLETKKSVEYRNEVLLGHNLPPLSIKVVKLN